MKNCREFESLIYRSQIGEASEEEREILLDHIGSCSNCSEVFEVARRLWNADLHPEPTEEDLLSMRRAVMREIRNKPAHSESWVQGAFRKETLAFASAVMLILGSVMHLGGYQSASANSIARLKAVVAVSAGLNRAMSMDCRILKSGVGGDLHFYRVRWLATGVTRVDTNSTDGSEETLWISNEAVPMTDSDVGAAGLTSVAAMPPDPIWQPAMEFLTPTILAQHIDGQYGLTRAVCRDGSGQDEFFLVGQNNQQMIEVAIDERTYLPTTIKKHVRDSGPTSEDWDGLVEVRFLWNQPFSQEPLAPWSPAKKRQPGH